MYEMKGALAGYAAPARLVADRPVPVPPVSQLHRTSLAAFPASPIRLGRFPGCPFPGRLVPSLTVSGSAGSSLTVSGSAGFPPRRSGPSGCPSAPAPRAARRCQAPAANTGFPAFPALPGKPPGWCPFPAVKAFLRPRSPVTQELAGIHFEFFLRAHVVHRIPPVIRISQRLSTGFCTSRPQVTWRNSGNTCAWSPYVIIRSFHGNIRLIRISPPRSSLISPAVAPPPGIRRRSGPADKAWMSQPRRWNSMNAASTP